jgi:hypothetical protein
MSSSLSFLDVSIDQLFLDPNNPRYAELNVEANVPDERVTEPGVQARAFDRMLDDRFDTRELKESIRTAGYLPMDRMVVVPLGNDQYRVVEGNRRLTALKSLLEDQAAGEIELSESSAASIKLVPVVAIVDDNKASREYTARLFQGVRHLASVKSWGPYEQAQLVYRMLEEGDSLLSIRQVLGLTGPRVKQLRRVFLAMEQMRSDPEFGTQHRPALFSQFDEALKLAKVREWLAFDEESGRIESADRRSMFYSWISPSEVDGEKIGPKIVDAKEFRELPDLMSDPVHWQQFLNNPRSTLVDEMRSVVKPDPQVDWRGVLQSNLNALNRVPGLELASATDEDLALLKSVETAAKALSDQIQAVRGLKD